MAYIGRKTSVGLGVESARGTAVAATHWQKHLELDFESKAEVMDNESAMGLVETTNDSTVVEKWAEGIIGGKITDSTMGVVLYGAFGSLATIANGDASGNVYDHTFSIQQSSAPTSVTVIRKDDIEDQEFALGTVDALDVEVATGDFAKFRATIKAKQGASTTSTPAYTAENEFTSKHVGVKLAANVAGISGASVIPISSLRLTVSKNTELYYATGDVEPTDISAKNVTVTGEITLRHEASTYKDLLFADTVQAMEIKLENTDVTIGTAANPSVTFTMPTIKFSNYTTDQSLDAIVPQTLEFTAHYDTTEAYAIEALLTNEDVSY